ncbi:MAG: FKBP-type peptidyl-prolyl cis-trans isomerase [Sphaerochaetaceae bacterium]|nr:FKBP-type peptidyl-prolyl cis-trans isomerase [Sphaerochaetaceae bacterium]
MKKTITVLLILMLAASVFAAGSKETAATAAAAEQKIEAAVTAYVPETVTQKFSWALGYYTALNNSSQYLDLDLEAFNAGVNSFAKGEELTQAELDKILSDYSAYVTEYYSSIEKVNLEAAELFLKENAQVEGVVTTDSGLQYMVIEEGTGNTPAEDSTVNVDYTLTLLDGSVVDSSYARGTSSEFNLNQVIKGFSEGICLMKEGSSYRFWIHPSLGYGESGNSVIAPNSLLIFDVVLHSIVQ